MKFLTLILPIALAVGLLTSCRKNEAETNARNPVQGGNQPAPLDTGGPATPQPGR